MVASLPECGDSNAKMTGFIKRPKCFNKDGRRAGTVKHNSINNFCKIGRWHVDCNVTNPFNKPGSTLSNSLYNFSNLPPPIERNKLQKKKKNGKYIVYWIII